MTRSACVPAVAVVCVLAFASPSFAQAAKPATPGSAAPAAPAKWIKQLKYIEVIRGQPKKVGTDMVTALKVKNTSDAAIALLRVDEIWYDHKLKQVTGDSYTFRRPVNPGEVVDVTKIGRGVDEVVEVLSVADVAGVHDDEAAVDALLA